MSSIPALLNTIRAARELRLGRMAALALYRLGLRSGHYRRMVDARLAQRLADDVRLSAFRPIWRLPSPVGLRAVLAAPGQEHLLAQAGEIVAGQISLFGAGPFPLRLVPPQPLRDWTAYESGAPALAGADLAGQPPDVVSADIKWLWEPARFGWVFTLGRAYRLTGNERYPQAFWQRAEAFLDANPPYLGPHWASAQEVALRLIAFTFALHVFQSSPLSRPERVLRLLRAIAVHAGRIPPTLTYARAQNNNHLLSEAAGLATAAALLPAHPQAARWWALGWREFRRGLRSQIASDGAYSQHSANYHRLMLQLGLWMANLSALDGAGLDGVGAGALGLDLDDRRRLAAATAWLLALLDPAGGRLPNLGPNDGAYIFPFSALPFEDYRPVLQAAGRAFLGRAPFPPGAWDEMRLWFPDAALGPPAVAPSPPSPGATPHVLHSLDRRSWAYLRAVRFTARPGHADQLHVDLWRNGENLALDAGTYTYNAPPPWDNALASSLVHNTVTIDGVDQMRRAGRFLYLDWAQADILPEPQPVEIAAALTARHNGYRRMGLIHQRHLQVDHAGVWEIVDAVFGPAWDRAGSRGVHAHTLALHWLLPNWPWEVAAFPDLRAWKMTLRSPSGWVKLTIQAETVSGAAPAAGDNFQIVRAGERVYGDSPAAPVLGWSSPTYGVKIPALSLRCIVTAVSDTRFISRFTFEDPDLTLQA